jgi:hypothetical protein
LPSACKNFFEPLCAVAEDRAAQKSDPTTHTKDHGKAPVILLLEHRNHGFRWQRSWGSPRQYVTSHLTAIPFLALFSHDAVTGFAPSHFTAFAHYLNPGQIESNYDEITDSFDSMSLKSELLRGTSRLEKI